MYFFWGYGFLCPNFMACMCMSCAYVVSVCHRTHRVCTPTGGANLAMTQKIGTSISQIWGWSSPASGFIWGILGNHSIWLSIEQLLDCTIEQNNHRFKKPLVRFKKPLFQSSRLAFISLSLWLGKVSQTESKVLGTANFHFVSFCETLP